MRIHDWDDIARKTLLATAHIGLRNPSWYHLIPFSTDFCAFFYPDQRNEDIRVAFFHQIILFDRIGEGDYNLWKRMRLGTCAAVRSPLLVSGRFTWYHRGRTTRLLRRKTLWARCSFFYRYQTWHTIFVKSSFYSVQKMIETYLEYRMLQLNTRKISTEQFVKKKKEKKEQFALLRSSQTHAESFLQRTITGGWIGLEMKNSTTDLLSIRSVGCFSYFPV